MKDCHTAGEYGSPCEHQDHFQQGGGWTPRSYVYCTLLKEKIYTEPPVPKIAGHTLEPYVLLLPDTCPVKRGAGQLKLL